MNIGPTAVVDRDTGRSVMSLFCSPFSDHCDRLQIQDFAGCGSLAVEGISHTRPNSHRFDTPERRMQGCAVESPHFASLNISREYAL